MMAAIGNPLFKYLSNSLSGAELGAFIILFLYFKFTKVSKRELKEKIEFNLKLGLADLNNEITSLKNEITSLKELLSIQIQFLKEYKQDKT